MTKDPSGRKSDASGIVKWFNTQKGYGFIEARNGGDDVFVHISAVEKSGLRSLDAGQQVYYQIQLDPKKGKAAAINIQLKMDD